MRGVHRQTLRVTDYHQDAFALLAAMVADFSASLDLESAVFRALQSIIDHIDAEAGSLWLLSDDDRELHCLASVGLNPITGLRLPANEGIVGRTVDECRGQQVFDAVSDRDFSTVADEISGSTTRSLICSPLTSGDDAIGAVQLINKRSSSGCFTQADADQLTILAASAGLAVANSRLVEAQLRHELIRRELALAAEIQRGLLPPRQPPPFPVVGVNVPARTVSGDFFDFLRLAEGRIGFCLGDVSGKGMNAALLMAKTASLYRCLTRDRESPGAVLARINDELCETATRGMFVTMVAGVYDSRSSVGSRGRCVLASAGHEPALLHHAAASHAASDHPRVEFERIEAQAPPLGIFPGTEFPEQVLDLAGGVLYVCSDGLTEAYVEGSQLGSEGFELLIRKHAGETLSRRIDGLAAEVEELDLTDDLTLLAVSDAE